MHSGAVYLKDGPQRQLVLQEIKFALNNPLQRCHFGDQHTVSWKIQT